MAFGYGQSSTKERRGESSRRKGTSSLFGGLSSRRKNPFGGPEPVSIAEPTKIGSGSRTYHFNNAQPPSAPGALPTDRKASLSEIMEAGQVEAKRLTDVEESRGAAAEDTMREAVAIGDKPTMTDDHIANWMSQARDETGQQLIERMHSLRDQLGASGIMGGGLSAAMASSVELSRLAQNTDARRSLYLEKTKADAADRLSQVQNRFALANQQQRLPSGTYMNFLGDAAGVNLSLAGMKNQRAMAQLMAKAQVDSAEASQPSIWESLLGFGGSVLGGAL